MTGQPDNVHPLEPWLDKKALAKHLGCGVRWVEYRVHDGMPHTIIAGNVRFRLATVDAWLRKPG